MFFFSQKEKKKKRKKADLSPDINSKSLSLLDAMHTDIHSGMNTEREKKKTHIIALVCELIKIWELILSICQDCKLLEAAGCKSYI